MTYTIWIDVEDLFEYALNYSRPTGIQRLSYEIYQTLQQRDCGAGRVRFLRHLPLTKGFRLVPWSDISGLFERLTQREERPAPVSVNTMHRGAMHPGDMRQRVRTSLYRLPPVWRVAVINMLVPGQQLARASASFLSLVRHAAGRAIRRPFQARRPRAERRIRFEDAFAGAASPGDVLLVLGSPWSNPAYAAMISHSREKWGLRFGLLVYDLIPLRRPEWCDAGLVTMFRAWFESVLPLCDNVFAISHATAADVEAYVREQGIKLPGPVVTIPIGTELGGTELGTSQAKSARTLPPPGTYALIVSTIEARKNHLLLFRVWRRLLEELPREQVPTLVFAGRVGWLVDDLMRQIANTANLDGKLVLIESPSDGEIAALYTGCLFTLFPSFFEGWGLPVTESLAFGKPCIISDRTSLPEVGGTLVRSFDPDNLNDAYAVIADTITDRPGLAAWEARVREEFKPVSWSTTVDALLSGLGCG